MPKPKLSFVFEASLREFAAEKSAALAAAQQKAASILAEQQRVQDVEVKRIDAARQKYFAEYLRDVSPFVDVLQSLPADKDGNKFYVRTDLDIPAKDGDKPVFKMRVYYAHPRQVGEQAAYVSLPDGPVTSVAQQHFEAATFDAPEGSVLLSKLAHAKYAIFGAFHPQHDQIRLFDEITERRKTDPAYGGLDQFTKHDSYASLVKAITKWIVEAAPERIPHIKKAIATAEKKAQPRKNGR